jgi:hypothetical protein
MSDDPDEELQAEKAYVQHQHSQLRTRYREKKGEYDEATDLMFRLPSGTMSVPEWLRHACTDTFFDSFEDVDAPSIPEVVLDTLLKVCLFCTGIPYEADLEATVTHRSPQSIHFEYPASRRWKYASWLHTPPSQLLTYSTASREAVHLPPRSQPAH